MIFDAIATFTLIINKSFDDRLAVLDDKIVSYANKMRDPHLRLLDSKYDPGFRFSNRANAVDLSALSDVEKPLVRCLYADRLGLGQRVLQELGRIEDNGGYGTTHFLIGCVILKKFSSIHGPMLDEKIEACLAKMMDAQKYESASDLFFGKDRTHAVAGTFTFSPTGVDRENTSGAVEGRRVEVELVDQATKGESAFFGIGAGGVDLLS